MRSYLYRRVGEGGLSTDYPYDLMAQILRRLGFTTFDQVEVCIKDYDGDQLSRILRQRKGSNTRFEHLLLAGMGTVFVERVTDNEGWREGYRRALKRFEENGIPIGNYDPQTELRERSSD